MYGMKRGFLKSKALNDVPPPKNASSDSNLKLVRPEPAPINTASSIITIPTGKIGINNRGVPSRAPIPAGALKTGMNFVTIPRPESLPFERWSFCVIFLETKEAILKAPNFPAPLQSPSYPLPYMIDTVAENEKGSGLGVFATRDIEAGELIMSERPLIILPEAIPYVQQSETPARLLERWFSFLPADEMAKIRELSNCKGEASGISGIFDTNALYVGRLPGEYEGAHLGVCHTLSRVNHSCAPNAAEFWDFQTFSFQLRAARQIVKGEQIYITYTNVYRSRAERQKDLKDKYSFVCECAACSLIEANGGDQEEAERSDKRRSLLLQYPIDPNDETKLKKWLVDPSLPDDDITKESLAWLRLMEMEGMLEERTWVPYVQRLVKSYCALRDAENATKWAKKGAAWTRAANGTDGDWDAVAKSPERTNWWGLRVIARAANNIDATLAV